VQTSTLNWKLANSQAGHLFTPASLSSFHRLTFNWLNRSRSRSVSFSVEPHLRLMTTHLLLGPRQLSLSRVRVPRDSWPYFTVSDLRLPFSLPPMTRRVTVEVFKPAYTRVCAYWPNRTNCLSYHTFERTKWKTPLPTVTVLLCVYFLPREYLYRSVA
jgi:hypothetical protein